MSIVSSALIGTASGSSVANVVVDGVFNIPLMKASGFRGAVAGAIEAMNSTGGQIVPPVMGAGAFLMAEILGVPYPKVALAAVIPAFFYFVAAYFMIDFYSAVDRPARASNKEDLPIFHKIMLEKGYLLIPIIVLLVCLMVFMYSPYRSAMIGIISLIVVSWVRSATRMGPKAILDILSNGARGVHGNRGHLRGGRHHRRHPDPDRPGDEVRHDHLQLLGRQPLHRARLHDDHRHRPRHGHAHHGRLCHLRLGSGAGPDPDECPGDRRPPVHLLLCLPLGA